MATSTVYRKYLDYGSVVLVLSAAVLVLVIENTPKNEYDYEHRSATPH